MGAKVCWTQKLPDQIFPITNFVLPTMVTLMGGLGEGVPRPLWLLISPPANSPSKGVAFACCQREGPHSVHRSPGTPTLGPRLHASDATHTNPTAERVPVTRRTLSTEQDDPLQHRSRPT